MEKSPLAFPQFAVNYRLKYNQPVLLKESQKMRIHYFGHAAFAFEGENGTVLIDPFITGNLHMKGLSIPKGLKFSNIILSHGHGDHVGDAVKISKEHNAGIIAVPELASIMASQGASASGCAFGGEIKMPWGSMRFVQAIHTSAYGDKYAGIAAGIILKIDGRTIYHAGDTAVFGDMALISRLHKPSIALLPIGGYYTMDAYEAVEAVKLIGAETVIPMHYNTFPVIQTDPERFKAQAEKETNSKVIIMKPLESLEIK